MGGVREADYFSFDSLLSYIDNFGEIATNSTNQTATPLSELLFDKACRGPHVTGTIPTHTMRCVCVL